MAFEIIPAIDLIEGKCVRLQQGDYNQKKVYNEQPLEVALQFEDAGVKRLHLVDLDGARAGRVINWKVLELLAAKTSLMIDFGGGVKTMDDARIILESGAGLVTVGSLAVKQPAVLEQMARQFGAQRFFIGADVKDEKLAIHGWLEQTDVWVYDFINEWKEKGLQQFFCTDIAMDGMMQGPSNKLYTKILEQCEGVSLTASGGVRHVADLELLQQAGLAGAIVGKAIYEGTLSLQQLKMFG
ncbi:MAG TPA: 1-(5-phosphoribosyl)-5-[(5-phosphoribosylamino)methylideneamino]imidazole-4-carboxamide isomerase [Phnomibacter sp.]|nr:1-(5-phosphoribosyl)-5-[(5-phosphoribosylamino)methylideneamino]imidazole-4-carboxamide isomerase [Phnomibacter sp.]